MKKFIITALAFAPTLVFAQGTPDLSNLQTLLRSIGRLVDIALPIVVAIALLVFFWGIVKLIWGGPEAVAEGKSLMIWGLVALFVMVAVWGLVRFIGTALGVSPNSDRITPPSVNIP